MPKIALVTDTHAGILSNQKIVERKTCEWFENIFFPYVIDQKITHIVHLGDLFHNRRAITTESGKNVVDSIIKRIPKGVKWIQIIGNHDSFFNDSTVVNSPYMIMGMNPNIILVNDFLHIPELDSDFYSWGNAPKNDTIKGRYAFGHWDIIGCLMNNMMKSEKGYDKAIFDVYHTCFSGHYHNNATIGNVNYVGSPIEQSFNEIDSEHFFYVFDTDNGKIEKIKNDIKIFEKIEYFKNGPDRDVDPKDKVLKVYIMEEIDQVKFNKWRDSLMDDGAIEIIIIEKMSKTDVDDDIIKQTEDMGILELMQEYENLNFDNYDGLNMLKKLTEKVYNEVEK